MDTPNCHCVFPSPSEEELITVPGEAPNSAIRALVEPGPGGYVRLQQLAYDAGLGWYVQKSFVIPGEMLSALLPQLRRADCLIPRLPGPSRPVEAPSFMRIVPQQPAEAIPARRRGA